MREWLLSEVNYQHVKENPYQVAVLPIGATEPHNLHLPYGTDTIQVETMAARACERAYKKGGKVIMLPPLPYGTETNMIEYPFAMNLQPSTILNVISDFCEALETQGIYKLVIVNGHGGNDFKPLLRELLVQTEVNLFLCDWFRGIAADAVPEIFEQPGDHADEVETSLVMAIRPELVGKDPDTGKLIADDGSTRASRFEAVNKGWVSISRPFGLLTTNTGSGNPHAATPEKGEKLLNLIVERLGDFLFDLSEADIDIDFPFESRN
ncbi:Creatinine amidohydrolase [Polystyrenella longa]|uniref:Creatinine amidohydrolase n=1 Tax=Polystyrenella longa TaxID=2528007 RepID=A0A518CNX2_9PLAN|nr:creatininase family protein [Polystyrenella longa]QDU80930.1 Creatinine amidohydrolase [Polystyrenella longa]